jgi:Glycosyl hydrolase catalytic core
MSRRGDDEGTGKRGALTVRIGLAVSVVLALAAVAGVAVGHRGTVNTLRPKVAAASAHPSPVASGSPTTLARAAPSAQAALMPAPVEKSPAAARPARPSGTSKKKGVSTWYFDGEEPALADVRASWYYNWANDRQKTTAPAGVEFVPMIWGAGSVTPAALDTARKQGKTLLGFNEPDFASQSNMSVQQALDLWPQLMATGMRLGSPAPATGAATAGGWLDQFMTGAAARGYRVDFIALHWYGSDFSAAATSQLRSYLQATYDRYHKPIWLTEYALIKFGGTTQYPTQDEQAAFVRASTAMMDGLPFVERYAWFSLPTNQDGADGTGLYRNGTTPTMVGAAYRSVG